MPPVQKANLKWQYFTRPRCLKMKWVCLTCNACQSFQSFVAFHQLLTFLGWKHAILGMDKFSHKPQKKGQSSITARMKYRFSVHLGFDRKMSKVSTRIAGFNKREEPTFLQPFSACYCHERESIRPAWKRKTFHIVTEQGREGTSLFRVVPCVCAICELQE